MKGNLLRRDAPAKQLPFDYATQFGNKKRENNVKAFPFFYNFIRYPYQVGNDQTGIYQVSAADAEGPDGLQILPNGILDIPVVMDNDYPFHLLYMKYGAFRPSSFTVATLDAGNTFAQPAPDTMYNDDTIVIDSLTTTTGPIVGQVYYVVNALASTFQISLTSGGAALNLTSNGSAAYRRQGGRYGSRERLSYPYTGSNPASPGQGLVPTTARNTRTPYWADLDVSVYVPSSGSRDLYGGFQREGLGGSVLEVSMPISSLQGAQDGLGMIKTPYQLPASATVSIRVKSRAFYPLRVYGVLFGYKITI